MARGARPNRPSHRLNAQVLVPDTAPDSSCRPMTEDFAGCNWPIRKHATARIPQALHWLTVICVAAGWLLGQFDDDFPKGRALSAFALHSHHARAMRRSCCSSFVSVAASPIRRRPPEATPFGRLWQSREDQSLRALCPAARGAVCRHRRSAQARPRCRFSACGTSSPWPADRATAKSILRVHRYLANTLLALAGLHAAAALLHHYVRTDSTLLANAA